MQPVDALLHLLAASVRSGCLLAAFVLAGEVPATAQVADRDGDGVANDFDNCPEVANRDQADGEHDRVGNPCDNCPAVFNPDQDDRDGDGGGDACVDDDADGVLNADDLCAQTRPGTARLGLGCSPLDLVRPSGLIDALRTALDDASAEIGSDAALGRVSGKLTGVGTLLAKADCSSKQGKICRAAALLGRVARRVAKAEAKLARVRHQEGALPHFLPTGDVTSNQIRALSLMVRQEVLAAAGAAVDDVRAVFDAGCSAVGEKRKLTGLVASIDDAAGRLVLADGMALALPQKRFASGLGVGRQVKIRARDLGDGTALVQGIAADKADASLQTVPCIALRVAPVQRFAPQFPGPYTLHALAGYQATVENTPDVLLLERGMRLAAEESPCSDTAQPPFTSIRRNLAVTVECTPVQTSPGSVIIQLSQGPVQSLAPELTAADGPVPLPCCDSGTLTVVEHRQPCRDLANGQTICDPVEIVGTAKSYPFVIEPRNFYCGAQYDRTEFAIEDDNPNLAVARLDGLTLDASVPAVTLPAAFHAEGYAVVPFLIPTSTFPFAVDIATVAPPYEPGAFAIYNQYLDRDFYKESAAQGFVQAFHKYQQLQLQGVDRPSGLRWPHVVGTRGNAEFSYSCALPSIVRDVIAFCFSAPDTLYRWPFHTDSLDLPTSGACGFPDLGHCAYFEPVDPTCTMCQRYAYDVGMALGTPIFAGRGGLVIRAVGDEDANMMNCCAAVLGEKQCSDPDSYTECVEEDPFCTCFCKDPPANLVGQARACTIGNYLWIKHSDGTIGIYFHMQNSSSGPAITVAFGDRVARDQMLGRVGNSGNSSGPHLHFEEAPPNLGLDNLMRFQIRGGVCSGTCTPCTSEFDCVGNDCVCNPACTNTVRNCYIPRPSDTVCAF